MLQNKCANARPPVDWMNRRADVLADNLITLEDREKAKWLLANTAHYRHSCINELSDIDMIACGIAMERERVQWQKR